MPKPVVRFDVGCHDLWMGTQFYRRVFGWEFNENGPYSHSVTAGAEGGPQGSVTSLPHEPNQYIMIYISVDDVAATLALVRTHGGVVELGPLETPQGGSFAWIRDVSGNLLAVTDEQVADD